MRLGFLIDLSILERVFMRCKEGLLVRFGSGLAIVVMCIITELCNLWCKFI